jgi:hypothetical protein
MLFGLGCLRFLAFSVNIEQELKTISNPVLKPLADNGGQGLRVQEYNTLRCNALPGGNSRFFTSVRLSNNASCLKST